MPSRILLAVVFCLAIPSVAPARDVFVNNVVGDDGRDGSSPEGTGTRGGPCRTITRALQLAGNGDHVILAPTGEPYRESITLQAERHSGQPGRPFMILGNGAVLDGAAPVPQNAWEPHAGDVYRFRPPRMSHQILSLDGKPLRRRPAEGGRGVPRLKPLEWCLHQGHIYFCYFCAEKNRTPREYHLSYTALPVGITLYEIRHVVIRDVVVQGYQLDGVNAHDGVVDSHLVGLKCRGNGRSGISVGGASRVSITACVAAENGEAQVRTEGFSRTAIVNCQLDDTTAPALVRDGGRVTMLANGAKR